MESSEQEKVCSTQPHDAGVSEPDEVKTTEINLAVEAGETAPSASNVVAGTGEECETPVSGHHALKAESSIPVSSETAEASAAPVSCYSDTTSQEANVSKDEGAASALKDTATTFQKATAQIIEECGASTASIVAINLEGNTATDPSADSEDSPRSPLSSMPVSSSTNEPEETCSSLHDISPSNVASTPSDIPVVPSCSSGRIGDSSNIGIAAPPYQHAGPSNESTEGDGRAAAYGLVDTGTSLYRSRSDSGLSLERRDEIFHRLFVRSGYRRYGDFSVNPEESSSEQSVSLISSSSRENLRNFWQEETRLRHNSREQRIRRTLLQENRYLGSAAVSVVFILCGTAIFGFCGSYGMCDWLPNYIFNWKSGSVCLFFAVVLSIIVCQKS